MKIIGIRTPDGTVSAAWLHDEGQRADVIAPLEEFWRDPEAKLAVSSATQTVNLSDVEIVPPVLPSARVLCVGLNYRDHVAEGSYADVEYPPFPTIFARWASTLTVHGAPAPIPTGEEGLDWEGEIVAYVGRTLVDADPDTAREAVVGYSAFNDLTSRRAQKLTSQWILGKNGDDSGPLSPMVTVDEVGDLRDGIELRTFVNGTLVQEGNTRDQVYELGEVLSHISHTITLRPGDLVATGTPAGVGYARTPAWFLKPGDVVEVTAESIGSVRTPIVDNSHRLAQVATNERNSNG